MLKIKDKDGKALYTVTDEATEPTPTPECLSSVTKKEEVTEEEEKKD